MGAVIQSITITSHATQKEFTVYNIFITTPSSTHERSHRYSDFKRLYDQLAASIGSNPPGTFPAKRYSGWAGSVTSMMGLGSRDLTEEEKVERRSGLERWIRGLLSNRDPRWSEARVFTDFLAPVITSSPGSSSNKEKRREFTPSTWLSTYQQLVLLSRTLKTTFGQRDVLMIKGDALGHGVNAEAKKGLVELVVQLEELTNGLKELAKAGMTEGELQRRRQMLGTIQDEVDTLGKAANSIPRATATSASTSNNRDDSPGPPSSSRNALFASSIAKPTSRILGFGASPTPGETAQTRPLDNQGLLQLQQTYVDQQDSKLDSLTTVLRRQRDLGMMIGRELEEQSELLDGIDRDVDRVQGKLKGAQKQARRLG
jgi:regulator of vacuolar morphogenesis